MAVQRADWAGHGDPGPEQERLRTCTTAESPWRAWGPYVAARQWGTVREDYSADGDAWRSFPFDAARSRAYRWGEDGLAAVCDRWQHLCLGLALWNGADPFLKERLFGLGNPEGNHGEDVKEYWWPLDSTPTHSYLDWLYRYPQRAFPYEQLRTEAARRDRSQPEHELLDTGVLDEDRFFDVRVTYAKAAPDDLVMRVRVHNRGPDDAVVHVLPTLWFRNTWAWGRDDRRGVLRREPDVAGRSVVAVEHGALGRWWLTAEGAPPLLFTDNETNCERLFGSPNRTRWVKDGIDDHVVHGLPTVSPDGTGTKASAWYVQTVPAGGVWETVLRLSTTSPGERTTDPSADDRAVLRRRADECEQWARTLCPEGTPDDARLVQRRAVAGLLWGKQHYRYDVRQWLEGDPGQPPPPEHRGGDRNAQWRHVHHADVISMPDEWEYPWFAAWDLAFHTVPLAPVDPQFAKDQLLLLCREWYMHPDGRLPAYEWAFGDANPPVHAWAAWRVYKIDARTTGAPDRTFLARVFHKLLLNFGWWVNRKDADGSGVFEGGFLGLDNIAPFDRSAVLPQGVRLEQSDATSWMAMYCLNMLAIALELAVEDRAYEDVATKFFEHFLAIAAATTDVGATGVPLWDEQDGFFYDVLRTVRDGQESAQRLRVRSLVGLVPLLAVETLEPHVLQQLPDFARRVRWFERHRPDLCRGVVTAQDGHGDERRLLSLVGPDQLPRLLARMLDEEEFLSPYGVRSLSAAHRDPVRLLLDGAAHEVAYEPGESGSALFGGNSNWRGPVWLPLNFLLVEALQKHHHYYGDAVRVPLPTGSSAQVHLGDVADDLSRRLVRLFRPDAHGSRPSDGPDLRAARGPLWRDHVTFYEYFHGDDGTGLGASHQTGWTALVAKLVRQMGPDLDRC